jgi:hypothetical protein
VAYSVDPFNFRLFKGGALPPLSDGRPDNAGNQPDLPRSLDYGQANEFQEVHWTASLSYSVGVEGSGRRLVKAQIMKNDFEYSASIAFVRKTFDAASCYGSRPPRLKVLKHEETRDAVLDRPTEQIHV